MNKTKRICELIAAIISIIGGAILTLGSAILLLAGSSLEEVLNNEMNTNMEMNSAMITIFQIVFFVMLCISISIIVLAALLCTSPIKKDGTFKKRLPIQLTLAILLGLLGLLEISNIVYALFFLTPCVLLIISMCLKNNVNQNY